MSTIADELVSIDLIIEALRNRRNAVVWELGALRAATGAKTFSAARGTATFAVRRDSVTYDPADLAEWVHSLDPDAAPLRPVCLPWAADQYDKRLVIEDGEVVDSETGEVVPWAHIKPGSEYMTVRIPQEHKDAAVKALTGLTGWVVKKMIEGGHE